ncbi:hypothetical protein JB92DRAFT_2934623 [Gautieria morchelliformis]|nr:hypothetical protein JB92DRAFT_2934623 [Gautieria morchelliformis]
MLIADPSSSCDVCFETFSSSRECWCIPCGHIFCRECLGRLTQAVCPVCRTSLRNPNFALRPIRKVHVDLSKCPSESVDGPDSRNLRELRNLEQRIMSETREGHELTVRRAANLAERVGMFLRTQSPNEVILFESLIFDDVAYTPLYSMHC